jgi:serine/threonine-protein kinase PknK
MTTMSNRSSARTAPRETAYAAHNLWIGEGTVEKHVHRILRKLRLPAREDDQRRVLAVITYLDTR